MKPIHHVLGTLAGLSVAIVGSLALTGCNDNPSNSGSDQSTSSNYMNSGSNTGQSAGTVQSGSSTQQPGSMATSTPQAPGTSGSSISGSNSGSNTGVGGSAGPAAGTSNSGG